jgi:hypothetical protein
MDGTYFAFELHNSGKDGVCRSANGTLCNAVFQLSTQLISLKFINPPSNCSHFTVTVGVERTHLISFCDDNAVIMPWMKLRLLENLPFSLDTSTYKFHKRTVY